MDPRRTAARLEYRARAVGGKGEEFAANLERTLQELTDEGYDITGQLFRGEDLIVTGRKVVADTRPAVAAPPSDPAEVLLYYLEAGEQKQQRFSRLVDGLRVVQEHLRAEDIVPICLVTVERYDPPRFPALLRMFAKDLGSPPAKLPE